MRSDDTNAFYKQRWMHSMHVDAFHEYLLGNPHPYWTEIPATTNPVNDGGRDGVAAEDDMALRSLLPHIRPRRGRKRPEEGSMSRSPSQRPKTDDTSSSGGMAEPLGFWATHPDVQNNDFLFAPQAQASRMTMEMTQPGAPSWTAEDFVHTPISAHSYSAIESAMTPNTLWSERQQKHIAGDTPSVTTSTGTKQNRRHGAKVVSSAWRTGGPGGSGKTRGRPPMKRQNTSRSQSEGRGDVSPFSAFPTHGGTPPSTLEHQTLQMDSSNVPTALMTLGSSLPATTITATAAAHTERSDLQGFGMLTQHQYDQDQRTRRGRLTLRVPERVGDKDNMGTQYPQHERGQPPIIMIDGSLASGQPSLFTPQGLVGPEIQMMDPFAEPSENMYFSFQQQHRQFEQDPRLHTVPRNTPSYPSEVSTQENVAEKSSQQQHPTPVYHQQQQQIVIQPPPPTATPIDGGTIGTNTPRSSSRVGGVAYHDVMDRTNLEAVESLLTYTLLGAMWHDNTGEAIPTCEVDEAMAIAAALVETVRKGATSQGTFVSNIATLVGTTFLKNPEGPTVRVYRANMDVAEGGGIGSGGNVYDIHWDLRLGDVRGGFHLREKVSYTRWKNKSKKMRGASLVQQEYAQDVGEEGDRDAEGEDVVEERGAHGYGETTFNRNFTESEGGDGGGGDGSGPEDEAERWRRKYQALLGVVQEQNAELSAIRSDMVNLVRSGATARDTGRSRRPGRD